MQLIKEICKRIDYFGGNIIKEKCKCILHFRYIRIERKKK